MSAQHGGLEEALADEERQTARYEQSIGTTGELSAYLGLRAATHAVHGEPLWEHEPSTRLFFSVAADRNGPGAARAELADWLHGRVEDDALATIALLASETVTNAVTHGACTTTDTVDIEGDLSRGRLWVGVTNTGPSFDAKQCEDPGLDPGGRGLFLVDQLSRSWGMGHAGGATSVWFEVDRAA
jgi:anti-sigma regulatory factor (Ser/Thr protein kinase)